MKDATTCIEKIKTLLRDFAEERNWDRVHAPKDLAIAVSTEAAEILEHFRFRNGDDLNQYLSNQNSKRELSYEIADVFAFLIRLCDVTEIDLAAALNEKIEKNRKRYPVLKKENSSTERTASEAEQK